MRRDDKDSMTIGGGAKAHRTDRVNGRNAPADLRTKKEKATFGMQGQ
jgi:hypothetical protein